MLYHFQQIADLRLVYSLMRVLSKAISLLNGTCRTPLFSAGALAYYVTHLLAQSTNYKVLALPRSQTLLEITITTTTVFHSLHDTVIECNAVVVV